MEPPEGSPPLAPAAELLLEFLQQRDAGEEPDFAALCAAHRELADELRRLLTRYESLARTTEPGIAPSGDSATGRAAETLLAELGDAVARRYATEREIARGGMGIILEAADRPLRRRVAMKVLHGAGGGGEATPPRSVHPRVLARFLAEAQITGQLEHPGIVPVHDLGIGADGRVYYTMPLVRGLDLQAVIERAQAGEEGWSVPRVLGVLVRACEAIAYAHDKGVVHRDLKPSNIMVGSFGETYVLDWGLAHVLGSETEARAALDTVRHDEAAAWQTVEGSVVGTPAYMAPEQARSQRLPVDARTDVYALGAILYELLTGRMPYVTPGAERTAAEILQRVQAGPPQPLAELAPKVAQELASICERAMARDASERYPDALSLRDDLRAFLEGRVVRAHEAGALAELRKWMRRNRALASSLACLALALVLGAGAVAWQASVVNAEAKTRREVAGFLREMLTSIDPALTAGEPLTVREMLDGAAGGIDERLEDAPLVRAEIHDALGSTYYLLGAFEEAEQHLRAAVEGYQSGAGESAEPTLLAMASLGLALQRRGALDEAEALLRDARNRPMPPDGEAASRIRGHLAMVLDALGREEEALPLYRENYERSSRRLGPEDASTLLAQSNLGASLMNLARREEALPLVEACYRRHRDRFGADHPDTIMMLGNLAGLHAALGDTDLGVSLMREAVERSDRVLGYQHLSSMRRHLGLASLEFQSGEAERALETSRAELELRSRALGTDHMDTIEALELTVTIVGLRGDLPAAEALALDWYGRAEAELGAEHRVTGRVAHLLVNLYEEWGRDEEQAEWGERVRASKFVPDETVDAR